MAPDPQLLARFAERLDALLAPDARIGVAVSGGPDSLALLLLAAAARPGRIEAATVDHRLRPEAAAEAAMVAATATALGVRHATLTLEWAEAPASALQERARTGRYAALAGWAGDRRLVAILTAHHGDDQAETLLMRLARGAGVRGLAAIRADSPLPGSAGVRLVRPLLDWRRDQLAAVCAAAGLRPVADPGNADERFERVRLRQAIAEADWLDPPAIARSAAHLADADEALDWATERLSEGFLHSDEGLSLEPGTIPPELLRRLVARAIERVSPSAGGEALRGRETDRLLATLAAGGTMTLRGVACRGGSRWRFRAAPPHKAPNAG